MITVFLGLSEFIGGYGRIVLHEGDVNSRQYVNNANAWPTYDEEPIIVERMQEIEKALLGSPLKERQEALRKETWAAKREVSRLAHELELLNDLDAALEEQEQIKFINSVRK